MTNAREWARFWRCLGRSDHEYLDISEGHRQSQGGTVFVQSGPGTACLRWSGQLISQSRRRAHVVSDCNPVAAACCELRLECRLGRGLMPVLADQGGSHERTRHRVTPLTVSVSVESDDIEAR